MTEQLIRTLTVFDKRTEELVAEHPLPGVTLEILQDIFGSDDPYMYDCYPVNAEIAAKLEKYVSVTFDFSGFHYYVEATAG